MEAIEFLLGANGYLQPQATLFRADCHRLRGFRHNNYTTRTAFVTATMNANVY